MITYDDSGIVASDCDVLRPCGCSQAKDQNEYRHHKQHCSHGDGLSLPPLERPYKNDKWVSGMNISKDMCWLR